MRSPASDDGGSRTAVRLASGTLVLLMLTGYPAGVPPPLGASRSAAAGSVLTEGQMSRFQIWIRRSGSERVGPEAPERGADEAPPVEPVAGPPARPAETAAAVAPTEGLRREAAADHGAGAVIGAPRAAEVETVRAIGVDALRAALAATKERIEEETVRATEVEALRAALAATKGRIEELRQIGGRPQPRGGDDRADGAPPS